MTLAPLTPEDCDLRGYEWMPLFGGRLFTSTFEAHACDLAFRVAIKLYWECWQQVPAASLPNDDVQLCRLAGLGRDLKTWRKLRADGVLHGFRLCSDDRLYHGMLAAEALKAWASRQQAEKEKATSRERMRRWRTDSGLPAQEWDRLRAAIFARDGSKCVDCGSVKALHCDHIIPLAFGGSNEPDNLATRCSICHGRKTAKQQNPNKRPPVTAHKPRSEPPREPERIPDVSLESRDVSRVVSLARDKRQDKTREEKEDFLKNTSLSTPLPRARGVGQETPDEPSAASNASLVTELAPANEAAVLERDPRGSCDLPEPFAVHVRRAATAMTLRRPYGEVRSVDAQRDALAAQPGAVGADAAMGLRWQPVDPIRTVEEQKALLMADMARERAPA